MLKRSTINQSIEIARRVFAAAGLHLPAFATWSVEEWDRCGREADEIRDCMLGWDVTDFGSGDFANIGRTLFTLRNGRHNDSRYPKTYAEKFILDPEGQRAPAHFHRSKREDRQKYELQLNVAHPRILFFSVANSSSVSTPWARSSPSCFSISIFSLKLIVSAFGAAGAS